MELVNQHRAHEGRVEFYKHRSEAVQTEMNFGVFLPPQSRSKPCPVLYFLAGLTCDEQLFMYKGGALKKASELGLILVTPDTSPRGAGIKGEDDDWDFGSAAGFYLNATQAKWATHYRMDDYVTQELPKIIKDHFPADTARSGIFGHSMGGHGALTLGLKNPQLYQSISAFAPICAPMQCPWGEKAFSNYLGSDKGLWEAHDANQLIKRATTRTPILIDQGTEDNFLKTQLKPELLEATCKELNYPLSLNYRDGYDHSYYFISTFVESHLTHHYEALSKS